MIEITGSVIVGVALTRPPVTDELRKVVLTVEADTLTNAEIMLELVAAQIVSADHRVVMPVSTEIEWVEL